MEYNFIQYREESAFGLDLWGREWSSDLSPVSPFYLLKMTLHLSCHCVCVGGGVCVKAGSRGHTYGVGGWRVGSWENWGPQARQPCLHSLSHLACSFLALPCLLTQWCVFRGVFSLPSSSLTPGIICSCFYCADRPQSFFPSFKHEPLLHMWMDIAWEPQTTMMMWQSCHSARRQRRISVLLLPLQSKCAHSSPAC